MWGQMKKMENDTTAECMIAFANKPAATQPSIFQQRQTDRQRLRVLDSPLMKGAPKMTSGEATGSISFSRPASGVQQSHHNPAF